MRNIHAYMALFRSDNSEPPRESGYTRADVGDVDIWNFPQVPYEKDIIFPDVTALGGGLITGYALYNQPEDGDPLYIWMLPEPVDCHEGIVPFIHQGKLYRGLDVSAKVILQSTAVAAL